MNFLLSIFNNHTDVIWFVLGIIFAVAIFGSTIFFAVKIIREKRADKRAERKLIDMEYDEQMGLNNDDNNTRL